MNKKQDKPEKKVKSVEEVDIGQSEDDNVSPFLSDSITSFLEGDKAEGTPPMNPAGKGTPFSSPLNIRTIINYGSPKGTDIQPSQVNPRVNLSRIGPSKGKGEEIGRDVIGTHGDDALV